MRMAHSVPRSVSSGLLPNSNQNAAHQSCFITESEIDQTRKVHLISSDLWEAITGERLPPVRICEILNCSIPFPETSQNSQAFQFIMMSRDRQGSRIIQTKLIEGDAEERKQIFNSLKPSLGELIFDPCANFAIQKLCEVIEPDQQEILLNVFLSNIQNVVDNATGCRVLQKFIECTSPENVDAIFEALKDNLLALCISQNGNHIVQRFIDILPNRLNEIIPCIEPHLVSMAIDNCGCRVVQRLFERYDVDELSSLVKVVAKNSVKLATNQYGNYVVQRILDSGKTDLISTLIESFKTHFYEFSIHKFASNVIEKCIRNANEEEQHKIFEEIIGYSENYERERILKMVVDQFGNYVIQRIIKHGSGDQQYIIYEVVYDNYDALIPCNYAKHVITRLKAIGYEF